jgi:hypothetical protein
LPAATERPRPERPPLTPEQQRIVEWGDGPAVVIAGAGTGKTRVIVERVRWLLETDANLAPEALLVLTYNVKAARELRERIEAAVGTATAARLTVSNFHSFCHRVLIGAILGAPRRTPRGPGWSVGEGQREAFLDGACFSLVVKCRLPLLVQPPAVELTRYVEQQPRPGGVDEHARHGGGIRMVVATTVG